MRLLLASLVILGCAQTLACTPYDPSLPDTPFLCGTSDPMCPDGYGCTGMDSMSRPVCVKNGGTASLDGGTSGFQCADDSAIEGPNRNDTIANAWISPVASTKMSLPLAGLAICPAGDKDTYQVQITQTGQNLIAKLEYQADGAALSMTVMNTGGTAIASGSPAGTDTVMVTVNNLPTGSSPYYVQIYGPTTGENNYKLTLSVTGP